MESIVTAGLTAVIVAFVTFLFARRREREAEWRKLMFGQYQELLLAMSGIVDGRNTTDAQARYSDAVNSMSLVAPIPVVRALYNFQDEISYKNPNKSTEEHDRLLTILLRTMRTDMFPGRTRDTEEMQFRLIATPPVNTEN